MEAFIRIEFTQGSPLKECIDHSIKTAQQLNHPVVFDFNGKNIHVFSDSNSEMIYNEYHHERIYGHDFGMYKPIGFVRRD